VRLLNRQREREALELLLEAARAGRGGVLVLLGDAGVGKTALLDDMAARVGNFRVLRAAGVEIEMELPYSALQQLCGPIIASRDRLPSAQRDALAVALGLSGGPVPSPFLVGLAVLGLMSAVAEERPLLVLVDDAQWLDRESAIACGFLARRMVAEHVALVFALREIGPAFARLPELHVAPLGYRDAKALLESVLPAALDDDVLDRLVAETHGNPLALVELPRAFTPAQLAGGFGSPTALPVHAQIEASFTRRLGALPGDSRRLLLLAAADATGDPALLWRAASELGVSGSAADAIRSEGLIEVGQRVAFRHPLVRSAVYCAAELSERREAHRALACATDPVADPDRRAWHRAEAASEPDEDVASELERSADRARARGGVAAAAAFLERAATLTIDPQRRAVRALAAATPKYQVGALDEALLLVSSAESGQLDEWHRAEAEVLRARILFAADRGRQAPARLLAAARAFHDIDAGRARELYLDALTAALFVGRLGESPDALEIATLARSAPQVTPSRPLDLLLDGLALLVAGGPAAGTVALRQAVQAFLRPDLRPEDGLRWRWLAGRAAGTIWSYEDWEALTRQQIRVARDLGALAELPFALSSRVSIHLLTGEFREAALLVEEAAALAKATDNRLFPAYAAMPLAAFGGREAELSRLVRVETDGFAARGEGMGITVGHWANAVLKNGAGHYQEAFAHATQATVNPTEVYFWMIAVVELIEAASRSGHAEEAVKAVELLRQSTQASGTPWALGVEARSRALVSGDDVAEALYREAIDRLAPTRLQLDLARARLLYGEWLRRMGRRVDARTELRAAYDLFTSFGAEAFAERGRLELEASGERARKRTIDTIDQLTPQEAQVARLAALGGTNREIAAQLFISPRTVEYHLGKAFMKLEVKSRTQLARRLA